MTPRPPRRATARTEELTGGADRRAGRPWRIRWISALLVAGAAGCGPPHPSPRPLPTPQLSTTVRSTGPALAGPPLQLRVAPDPGTHSLTYTVTNAGSTATRATVEFAAGVAGVAVTTQQGTICTPNAQGMICDLGTLAPQDTVPIVLQEQSGQGAMNVPQACLDVPTASGPGARGCLAATTLDQATLSRLPSMGPSGIQPFANLADSLRLFVNPGTVAPPPPASARPGSPAPRGGTPSPEPEREVTVPFTNPSRTPVSMSLTLQVLDSQGAPLTVVRAQPLQGAVHQGPPSGVPGPAPASGLTWDTGSVPPRGTATLLLFVQVGQGRPIRVAGRFVARSAGGKVTQGAWASAVNGPSTGGPSPAPVTSTTSSTSQGSRGAGSRTPSPTPTPTPKPSASASAPSSRGPAPSGGAGGSATRTPS